MPTHGKRPGSVKKPNSPVNSDPWKSVQDVASGQTYWWNIKTNETTPLGAPKPSDIAGPPPPTGQIAPQPPPGGMMSGLAGVVAEGFAFGTGSALAHRAVGSFFGGGDHDSQSPSDSDGEDWDI